MNQVYKEVLRGDLTPSDAKSRVGLGNQEDEVYVTPEIVEVMLKKYLSGEIGAHQLSDWAAFLISNDVYVTEGWEDDSQADKYEPMWRVLQQLSTPCIDGPITKARVENYIVQLSNIESN